LPANPCKDYPQDGGPTRGNSGLEVDAPLDWGDRPY